jgi:hypothetical protein
MSAENFEGKQILDLLIKILQQFRPQTSGSKQFVNKVK